MKLRYFCKTFNVKEFWDWVIYVILKRLRKIKKKILTKFLVNFWNVLNQILRILNRTWKNFEKFLKKNFTKIWKEFNTFFKESEKKRRKILKYYWKIFRIR